MQTDALVVAKPKLIHSVFMLFSEFVFKIHKNKTSNVNHNTLCFRGTVTMQIVIVFAETILTIVG